MVPLGGGALVIDLIEQLEAPALIVARNRLGTINHTLQTLEVLDKRGIQTLGVVLNRCTAEEDASIAHNFEAIREHTEVPVLGSLPYCGETSVEGCELGGFDSLIEEHLELGPIEALLGRALGGS